MPAAPATFETFQQELARLVDKFDRDYPQFVAANYNEATLRNEFLDPFYRALDWDVGNVNGLIHTEREVDMTRAAKNDASALLSKTPSRKPTATSTSSFTNSMRSPPKKSPSSKAREIPLPRSKRTDPPLPSIPTDPRTWPAERHAFGIAARKYFARPQSPWSHDHGLAPEIVAACVVREVMLALNLARFPAKRWADWLTRRAHALYRVEKKFRARMDGPHEREYCYSYMRHWLYIGLHKSHWKYADVLPEEMWSGHPPTRESLVPWKRWRLPSAA